jgi:hypothetical protein
VTSDEGQGDESPPDAPESESGREEAKEPKEPQADPPGETPQRFRAADEESLDPSSFMVRDDAAAEFIVRGGSVARDRGDAGFIGELLSRAATALQGIASSGKGVGDSLGVPQLFQLRFGDSVVVQLVLGPDESQRLSEDGRSSPTLDAARTIRRLASAEPEDLLPLAVDVGEEGIRAYKHLLDLVASDDVEVDWYDPDVEEATLTSERAYRDHQILDREGEEEEITLKVNGVLSMADADNNVFGLKLPVGMERPPALKGKKKLLGRYDDPIGFKLKQENLWNSHVRATIRITRE